MNKSKLWLYFFLALIPAFLAGAKDATEGKDWMLLGLIAIYQGLLAIKAYQSDPKPSTAPDTK